MYFDLYQTLRPRMTLSRLMGVILPYFTGFGSFEANYIKLVAVTIRHDTIVAWCTLKYKIKNRPVAYYRVSKSYVVLGNARVKK